jgi:hypothetical protein
MISVQIYIKKNTLVQTGSVTTANPSPYTVVKNSAASYTTNQYKGHYIKITAGLGLGSIAYIVSNIATELTLQTAIQNDTTTQYEIYRADYQKLDLFNDEKISVTSSVANVNDIGKVFTDYSQSFTIPASKRNNQILSHWYESTTDNGYDHRQRYDGYVEVDTHRFKDGNFQLEKANKKNGFVESYTITFYGNLTQIKDIIKDDKLASLDFSPYNHTWNETEVQTRIESATTTGDIKYPLIGSTRKYYYQDSLHLSQDITTTAGAVNWNELFPAILVSNIFARIKAKYGIEFTGSFINEDQYKKLYLYLKPATDFSFLTPVQKLNFTTITTATFPELNLTTDTIKIDFRPTPLLYSTNIVLRITPATAFLTTPYIIKVYRNNILYRTYTNLTGVNYPIQGGYLSVQSDFNILRNDAFEFYYTIQSIAAFQYTADVELTTSTLPVGGVGLNISKTFRASAALSTIQSIIEISNYMPDLKIEDFLNGIIKSFNLIIIPKENNTFELMHLEAYYNIGKILDVTKYIYADEMEIERPKLFKGINFTYEKSINVLNNAFKTYNRTDYGDLIFNPISSNESASYDIKLPFENVLFEKAINTQFETATIIDKDLKPYVPKPMLIYCNGILTAPFTGTQRIQLKTTTGYNLLTNYNRFSNEYNSLPTDTTNKGLMTMNFGDEQSAWYNILAPQGLYYRHYKNYIDNLYNIKTRIVKVKALFPPSLLSSTVTNGYDEKLGIALNDRLIIRNKRYIINNMTIDLTTGEASLELLTDYRSFNAATSIGYKFATYDDVEFTNQATSFDTIVYKNDYDYFGIKGALNYLSYPTSGTYEYADILLPVSVPQNTSGVSRYDEIGIEYYKDGVLKVTQYIKINQLP